MFMNDFALTAGDKSRGLRFESGGGRSLPLTSLSGFPVFQEKYREIFTPSRACFATTLTIRSIWTSGSRTKQGIIRRSLSTFGYLTMFVERISHFMFSLRLLHQPQNFCQHILLTQN
jgi:hypothetical protein